MEEPIVKEYLASLSEIDLLCLKIAKESLGSLFDIKKSNDYMKWLINYHTPLKDQYE